MIDGHKGADSINNKNRDSEDPLRNVIKVADREEGDSRGHGAGEPEERDDGQDEAKDAEAVESLHVVSWAAVGHPHSCVSGEDDEDDRYDYLSDGVSEHKWGDHHAKADGQDHQDGSEGDLPVEVGVYVSLRSLGLAISKEAEDPVAEVLVFWKGWVSCALADGGSLIVPGVGVIAKGLVLLLEALILLLEALVLLVVWWRGPTLVLVVFPILLLLVWLHSILVWGGDVILGI